MRSCMQNTWDRAVQRSPPYTGFHHYVVPSGPRTASYPCLCKQWKKLPNTQILIISWILVPTTFFRSISHHPMCPHSEGPVGVTLCHQVPKPWAGLLSLSLHSQREKGEIVIGAPVRNSNSFYIRSYKRQCQEAKHGGLEIKSGGRQIRVGTLICFFQLCELGQLFNLSEPL